MSETTKKLGRSVAIAAFYAMMGGALASAAPIAGCSSSTTAAPTCDESKCKANNHCIQSAVTNDTKCRLTCATHTDCPANYHCEANVGGASPYCVADAVAYQPSDKGQWGAPCPPQGGIDTNPACDTAQGFWCYGASPTDANAFCTRFTCDTDADCGRGFYCGKANKGPSVKTTVRSTGDTWSICLPRTYCAPCSTDVDCGPLNGVAQHCVADASGATSFCAPECSTDTNCQPDARCATYPNFKACTPRAGTCVGDGSFCSPCRSDADCPQGYCWNADYSPEKFCTVKSGVTCQSDGNKLTAVQCPKAPPATSALVGCSLPANAPGLPRDQCVGYVVQGTGQDQGYVPGCWSKH